MSYDEGFKAGKADALDGTGPKASRLWKACYRDGYSDGYWKYRGAKKSW